MCRAMIALGCLLLPACGNMPVRNEFVALPADGWQSHQPVTLRADSIGAEGEYVLTLILRAPVSTPYPFRELYLERTTTLDSLSSTDTLRLDLLAPDGNRRADGVTTNRYAFPIDTLVLHPETRCAVTLRHIMRRDPLTSFTDIGLVVEELADTTPRP